MIPDQLGLWVKKTKIIAQNKAYISQLFHKKDKTTYKAMTTNKIICQLIKWQIEQTAMLFEPISAFTKAITEMKSKWAKSCM